MDFQLVHSLPGRVRLRMPALSGNPVLCGRLRNWLGEFNVRVRLNSWCASVVIECDVHALSVLDEIIFRLRVIGTSQFPAYAASEAPPRTGKIWKFASANSLPLNTLCAALCLIESPALLALTLPLMTFAAIPTWRRALLVLREERRLNVDFLDSIAIGISIFQGQFFTGAFILWMISLGDWIRNKTAGRSKRAIADLLEFQSADAWVVRGRKVVRIPAAEVVVGDTVVAYPGELIPVDGEVLSGSAVVDQRTVTGESLPVERSPGNPVYAGTIVRDGRIRLRAVRVGANTTAAQIVHLIEAAPMGETRIQNYAEQFADRLVLPQLVLSAGLYGISGDLNRLLSMLIVDYGTGIRVAAPTSVLASMTHAARLGILIKSGSHMEKLAKLDTILFDKTGTLTTGVLQVLDIVSLNPRKFPERRILALAAAAEARLKHPVSHAIVEKARREGVRVPERSGGESRIGLGVEARVNGFAIHIGNERYFRQTGIHVNGSSNSVRELNRKGCSTLLFAVDGELTGLIPYRDQIRPESLDVIRTLHNRGVRNTVMITGDNGTVARAVAKQLGIREFFSDTLPADKASVVKEFQGKGHVVAMVGDGINDSPALAHADIGIAMKNGADVARESADVVLMEDNLWKLLTAIDISKHAITLVRENYAIIAGLNTLALALAIPRGLVSPNIAALISNGSAILASLNAMRPILPY